MTDKSSANWSIIIFGNLGHINNGSVSFWPNSFDKCILLLCAQNSPGPNMFNCLIFTIPRFNICVTSSGLLQQIWSFLEFPGGDKTAANTLSPGWISFWGIIYVFWHGPLLALNQLCNQVLPQALHFKLLKSIIREKQSNQSGFKIINYSSPRSEAMLTVMIWDYICGRGRFLNMLPILGTTLNKLQLAWSTLFAIKMINVTWTPYTDDQLALCPSWRRKLRILLL